MKIIVFHLYHTTIRGTERASYDYADYNETLLHNKSIIILPCNFKSKLDSKGKCVHNEEVFLKFKSRFEIYIYNDINDLQNFINCKNVTHFYNLKSGYKDGIELKNVKMLNHCVFTSNTPHGDVYAGISCIVNPNLYVPHIVRYNDSDKTNYRNTLNLTDKFVIGRHGGSDTFDIQFVKDLIKKNKDITWLFLNTDKFTTQNNVIYLNETTEISTFINTCDAMIHARSEGETFGLAVMEFAVKHKPIMIYNGENVIYDHHIKCLSEEGLYYKNESELQSIIDNKEKFLCKEYKFLEEFSPENVMKKFNEVFLFDDYFSDMRLHRKTIHNVDYKMDLDVLRLLNYTLEKCTLIPNELIVKKLRIKLMCNFLYNADLCKLWNKMNNNFFIYVSDDVDVDYYVIINKPLPNEYYIPEKTIVFRMEPDTIEPCSHWNDFCGGVENHKKFMYFCDLTKYMNNNEWHLQLTYNELLNTKINKVEGDSVSAIVSGLYQMKGHKLRVDFLKYIENREKCDLKLHIYGHTNAHNFRNYKNPLPPHNKIDGLLGYKYHLAVENNSMDNYYTEKIIDGILSECFVFYWGCKNIQTFINPECYMVLPLHQGFEKCYQMMLNVITNSEWEIKINKIKLEKEKIIRYYSFCPRVMNFIKLDKLKSFVINLDKRPDRYENFVKEAQRVDFTRYERFSAFDGSTFTKDNKYVNLFRKRNFKLGEIGCCLSHFFLWRKCIQLNEPIFILEDDINFADNFNDKLSIAYNVMTQRDVGLLFVGYHRNDKIEKKFGLDYKNDHDNVFMRDIKYFRNGYIGGGTFSYIVTPIVAKIMVNNLCGHGFTLPVDYEMMKFGYSIENINMNVLIKPLTFSNAYDIEMVDCKVDTDIQKTPYLQDI